MSEVRNVYWDSCAWLGLLNEDADKFQALEVVWNMAKAGKLRIWTSALSIAEVYRVKCEGQWDAIDPANDDLINDMFDQDWVNVVQVDIEIAKRAKELLRTHEKLRKPPDAIHLASAIMWNVDQLHTYDKDDLLDLPVHREDGLPLEVCKADMIDGENLFNRSEDA
jgi:predicted nucleic acid-binding protein